jgi:hypothetical protein
LITDSATFSNNQGLEVGDDVYAVGQRNSTMIINSVGFDNAKAKSSIYASVITL